MVTPASRTTAVLLVSVSFVSFVSFSFVSFVLSVMFSFAMTSGLASDSDKFKTIITLRRVQKFGDMGL